MPRLNYMDVISQRHPGIGVQCSGDPRAYENLIHLEGDPIPPREVLDAELKELEQLQAWRSIQAERDRRKWGGIRVGDYWFHSDDTSRIQQLGLLMMGQNLPPGIMWKTMTGSLVEMTPTLATQIFQACAQHDITVFGVAEWHRAQMLAAEDPLQYNFSGGWPPIFGE